MYIRTQRLRVDSLSDEERKRYNRMNEDLRFQASVIATGRYEGRAEGRAEGAKENAIAVARNMKAEGISVLVISKCTGLSVEDIDKL